MSLQCLFDSFDTFGRGVVTVQRMQMSSLGTAGVGEISCDSYRIQPLFGSAAAT